MKTLSDLEQMKNQKAIPFENAYEFLIERLVDFYIAKSNGIDRIKSELSEWDSDAKEEIIREVRIRCYEAGVRDFNL